MRTVTMGQMVRTVPGYEDTILPGYEGEVFSGEVQDDGTMVVGIFVRRMPGGYVVPEGQEIRMFTLANKLEPLEESGEEEANDGE